MVDIHCHILPETDDGAKSWDIALEMCRIAQQDGIRHIVATPHANDEYNYDRQAHAATLQELQRRFGDGLSFSLGCDFHFSYDNLQAVMQDPDRFLINGTDYLLVEFNDHILPPNTDQLLERLVSVGITPIITHPERNNFLKRQPERVLRFAAMGCLIQITANSLTGFWGETAEKTAKWLLKQNSVHVIASDAHDSRHRLPRLSEAKAVVAQLSGLDVARALVEENPHAIVCGVPVPFFPEVRLH